MEGRRRSSRGGGGGEEGEEGARRLVRLFSLVGSGRRADGGDYGREAEYDGVRNPFDFLFCFFEDRIETTDSQSGEAIFRCN